MRLLRSKFAAPLAASAISVLSLWLLPAPFLWCAVVWMAAFARSAQLARAKPARGALSSLAVMTLVLGVGETVMWIRHIRDQPTGVTNQGDYPEGYFEPYHEALGYGPVASRVTHSRLVSDGDVLYDIEYTIDERGLRVSPPSDAREGIVFFGGSFTFGEGVADDQPLPYQLGLRTAETYRTDNFGFHGYGPHQMLRALETGMVEELVPATPVAVVYQMLLLHLRRSSGMEEWDEHGPQYVLGEGGEVEYSGRFSDRALRGALHDFLWKSYLVRRLLNLTGQGDIDLCAAIIARAQREVETRWPGCRFCVLLWDEDRPKGERVLAALRERGIEVLLVSDALEDAQHDHHRWAIHSRDMHPSAEAHAVLAEHLEAELFGAPKGGMTEE